VASFAPRPRVASIPRTPLPYGLFSVLGFRPDGDRWYTGGVQWESEPCGPIAGYGAPDCDPELVLGWDGREPTETGEIPLNEGTQFTVFGHYNCNINGRIDDFGRSRARAHLESREEARVEQALWTGDLGNTPNFAGANGFEEPFNVGSFDAKDAKSAVAALEQYFAEQYGAQGVIHMSRRVAAGTDPELSKKGGRLQTLLDTPVVAGTGYGDEKIVITGPLLGYRSAIDEPGNVPEGLFNAARNDFIAYAARDYLVGFDTCGLAVATLTTTP
jgi:hypothetical protein